MSRYTMQRRGGHPSLAYRSFSSGAGKKQLVSWQSGLRTPRGGTQIIAYIDILCIYIYIYLHIYIYMELLMDMVYLIYYIYIIIYMFFSHYCFEQNGE